jgi:hypothetical protein
MSSVRTTRSVLSAIAAGFIALMCAGPGTMILLAAAPSSAGLLGKIVCPSGSNLNARWVRYSYSKPGESNLEMTCIKEDGDPLKGHTWWFIKLFGAYFCVLFIPLLFLSLKSKASATSS